jgi:uncharacterized protein YcbX
LAIDPECCVSGACVAAGELIERFRPNLIVNTSTAFEEETWSTVMIGNNKFRVGDFISPFIYFC